MKYQQRDRWSHGDLLRLAHPKAPSAEHEAVFRWILSGAEGLGERTVKRKVNGEDRVATYVAAGKLPAIVEAFEKAKKASSKVEIVALINDCDLPREAIPTQWLNELEVWDALLQRVLSSIGPVQLDKIFRLECGNSFGNLRPFRADRWPVVGRQNQNRELPSNDVLLVFEVLIGRDERLELPFCFPEQIAVLQCAPAHLLCRANRVAPQEPAQRTGRACVEQDFHAAGWSVSFWAYSSTATACTRVTSGKQSRYSSRLRPLSRLVNKLSTGTRVPLKQGAPLRRSGSTQIGTPGG